MYSCQYVTSSFVGYCWCRHCSDTLGMEGNQNCL